MIQMDLLKESKIKLKGTDIEVWGEIGCLLRCLYEHDVKIFGETKAKGLMAQLFVDIIAGGDYFKLGKIVWEPADDEKLGYTE